VNCPKCGREMSRGAPHGPEPVQYECRPCNVYIGADPAMYDVCRAVAGWIGQEVPTKDVRRVLYAARDALMPYGGE
jgi:hypothetical protein